MHTSTKKWLFIKYTSLILIPLMIWFILNLTSIYDENYVKVNNFFASQPSKILFSIFIFTAFFFSALTISEIFEDYIGNEKLKGVANKLTFFFGIAIPLLTIICLIRI